MDPTRKRTSAQAEKNDDLNFSRRPSRTDQLAKSHATLQSATPVCAIVHLKKNGAQPWTRFKGYQSVANSTYSTYQLTNGSLYATMTVLARSQQSQGENESTFIGLCLTSSGQPVNINMCLSIGLSKKCAIVRLQFLRPSSAMPPLAPTARLPFFSMMPDIDA